MIYVSDSKYKHIIDIAIVQMMNDGTLKILEDKWLQVSFDSCHGNQKKVWITEYFISLKSPKAYKGPNQTKKNQQKYGD